MLGVAMYITGLGGMGVWGEISLHSDYYLCHGGYIFTHSLCIFFPCLCVLLSVCLSISRIFQKVSSINVCGKVAPTKK